MAKNNVKKSGGKKAKMTKEELKEAREAAPGSFLHKIYKNSLEEEKIQQTNQKLRSKHIALQTAAAELSGSDDEDMVLRTLRDRRQKLSQVQKETKRQATLKRNRQEAVRVSTWQAQQTKLFGAAARAWQAGTVEEFFKTVPTGILQLSSAGAMPSYEALVESPSENEMQVVGAALHQDEDVFDLMVDSSPPRRLVERVAEHDAGQEKKEKKKKQQLQQASSSSSSSSSSAAAAQAADMQDQEMQGSAEAGAESGDELDD